MSQQTGDFRQLISLFSKARVRKAKPIGRLRNFVEGEVQSAHGRMLGTQLIRRDGTVLNLYNSQPELGVIARVNKPFVDQERMYKIEVDTRAPIENLKEMIENLKQVQIKTRIEFPLICDRKDLFVEMRSNSHALYPAYFMGYLDPRHITILE